MIDTGGSLFSITMICKVSGNWVSECQKPSSIPADMGSSKPDTVAAALKWSTKTGHRVRVFSSIDFPIRLVVTHHYIRAVLVRCNIQ
ncbi:hypothetical protein, partial [Escherichia coli]|uniref:hypothetical protein n=1 Tax=Escherichia coli TaxID=562 RepID=UPI0025418DF2